MPPFAGDMLRAFVQFSMKYNAAAHARAQNHAEYRAVFFPRPVERLGQRKTVGVVGDADCAVQDFFEIILDRLAVEADSVGILETPGAR